MPNELSRDSQPGETVSWETIGGDKFVGVLKEWDNWTAIVTLADGKEKAVSC